MNFGRKKILQGNFLKFIGNGIGMPMKSGIKIFEFESLEIRSRREFPGNAGSIIPSL